MKGAGDQIDYGMRVYDPRIGKFLSVDPLTREYPYYTPYQFAGNKPIWALDLDGREDTYYTVTLSENALGQTQLKAFNEDETKTVHWDNNNKIGPLGEGTMFTFVVQKQAENGTPVGEDITRVFVPKTVDNRNIFQKWFGSESDEKKIGYVEYAQGHSTDFSKGFPKAAPGSEELDMKDWFSFAGSLRGGTDIYDLAEDYSKNEVLKKVVWTILKINDANEKNGNLNDHSNEGVNNDVYAKGEMEGKNSQHTYDLPIKKTNGGDSSTPDIHASIKAWNKYFKENGNKLRIYYKIDQGDTNIYSTPTATPVLGHQ